jgi:hypothetical protein
MPIGFTIPESALFDERRHTTSSTTKIDLASPLTTVVLNKGDPWPWLNVDEFSTCKKLSLIMLLRAEGKVLPFRW